MLPAAVLLNKTYATLISIHEYMQQNISISISISVSISIEISISISHVYT